MTDTINSTTPTVAAPKKRRGPVIALLMIALLALVWWGIRPGIFVVQPIGAVPDGVTIIYTSRGGEMPFVSSGDGMCLQKLGSVNLLCRGAAMSGFMKTFEDHIVLRMPYSEWLYLQSTDGAKFER
jgi:hypothetical protein